MILRLREIVDTARALLAVPHLISEQAALELRVDEVEQRLDDVAAIANEFHTGAAPERNRTPTSGGADG
jgi:hypothetical protein